MKQAEKFYLISDAAKQVQVESHVLRYWEDELKLPIKRNEMGHRYYTEEDIVRFREIRNLKEQGFQLKAIRSMLLKGDLNPSVLMEGQAFGAAAGVSEGNSSPGEPSIPENGKRHVLMVNKGEFVPVPEESREAKSYRLQQLLQNMITEAVRNNNQEVCEEIKITLLKELDYQFRLQEEKEDEREEGRISRQEEHYRQIDELIRTRNKRKPPKKKKEAPVEKRVEEDELLKGGDKKEPEEKPRKGFLLRKKRSVS